MKSQEWGKKRSPMPIFCAKKRRVRRKHRGVLSKKKNEEEEETRCEEMKSLKGTPRSFKQEEEERGRGGHPMRRRIGQEREIIVCGIRSQRCVRLLNSQLT
ncbi:hypothetical protein KFK09_011525 [Dendrobium nobile]|uniref:Uncharacterized protein n=1 Tax=Dendrobium nobile TaxID=94219 RepID=A0A8T3BET5_DENNO|nr:hypothetical protein KFK09_011525 [Dendrobium nobile]